MLNLRSISLANRPLGRNSTSSLSFSGLKFSISMYVGNAGASVAVHTQCSSVEYAEDFLELNDDEESFDSHDVSDDPLKTGIVRDVE